MISFNYYHTPSYQTESYFLFVLSFFITLVTILFTIHNSKVRSAMGSKIKEMYYHGMSVCLTWRGFKHPKQKDDELRIIINAE